MVQLEVHNLTKEFGTTKVLDDLSFSQKNNVLGIAGPNGSGKSTLLKCLAYLLRPTSGAFGWRINEQLLKRSTFTGHVGYIAPYINLYDELSGRENLEFICELRDIEGRVHGQIKQWLEKVDMDHAQNRPFGNLSTGQQQRIRIASALIHRPPILILDEPGSNLDRSGNQLIKRIVDDYRSQDTLTLIASNNKEELDWCDRVISVDGN